MLNWHLKLEQISHVAAEKDLVLKWTNTPDSAAPLGLFLPSSMRHTERQSKARLRQAQRGNTRGPMVAHSLGKSFYTFEKLAFWKKARVLPNKSERRESRWAHTQVFYLSQNSQVPPTPKSGCPTRYIVIIYQTVWHGGPNDDHTIHIDWGLMGVLLTTPILTAAFANIWNRNV